MIEEIIKGTKETSSHYRNEIIEPDVLRAFHKLGEILSYKKSDKENKIIEDIGELAKKSIPSLSQESFAFLFIGARSFSYYNSKNRNKKDKLKIRNPGVDIYNLYNDEGITVNIFKDDPEFVKHTLDEAIKHEGIFVLDRDSYNIPHNGLIIPIDFEDLYTKFGVNDDIELIEKTGYPKRDPLEIGTKSKAMLYFSIYHPKVLFMRFKHHCYIIQKGRIVYQCKKDDFKDISKSLPAMTPDISSALQ